MFRVTLALLLLAGCDFCEEAPVELEACCAGGPATWGPLGWYCVGPDGNPTDPALN